MNYWLTTQWPPYRINQGELPGVWLQEGHQSVGKDLCEGDHVLIYQIKSSPTEIQYVANGEKIILKRILGKGGIIAIAKVLNQISAAGRPEPSEYLSRKKMWWRWMASVEILSTGGIVLRTDVNKVLGYEPNYTLEGFGNKRSGLKKITEEVYRDLADRFRKSKSKSVLPPPRDVPRGRAAEGTIDESEEHRLLKEYVASDPETVLREIGLRHLETEYPFATGDQADVVLEDHMGRIIGVEIEVSVSDGQMEGILQAIKYRYMLEPIANRNPGDSRAFLVAYSISKEMKAICNKYKVETFIVSKNEVKDWASKQIPVIGIPENRH